MVSVRALLDAHARLDAGDDAGGVVALAVVAHHAAEQRVHRQVQHFAFDVPQRQVERAQRVHLFASRRIEERARHVLPEPLDIVRILPDQPAGALLQQVLGRRLRRCPVMPASVSTVTTRSLWLKSGFGIGRRPHLAPW